MMHRKFPVNPVLVVDDEKGMLKALDLALRSGGINNSIFLDDEREVMPLLRSREVDAILLDITMPHISGEVLLQQITEEFPAIPVIMVTGNSRVDLAVRCMKANAFDYMVKPVEPARLISGVKRALEIRRLNHENRMLKERLAASGPENPDAFRPIITRNPAMISLFKYGESIALSPHPVLITGETGTGKELLARVIHDISGVPGNFVAVNVAGIDDTAFSDTLFGHAKGAFTGADSPRPGLIETARGGTLFLDEIGDLKPESQVKLLRMLQEQEYFPLGSDIPKPMDARVITATNHDLVSRQEEGLFRKDLYFRLSTHRIDLPPLRERLEDLPLLLDHFLEAAAANLDKSKPTFPAELLTLLSNYPFPGNIRELEAMARDAVGSHKKGKLSMERFKKHLERSGRTTPAVTAPARPGPGSGFESFSPLPTMARAQFLLAREAMNRTQNNKSMAAELIGISRQRLARLLKSPPD